MELNRTLDLRTWRTFCTVVESGSIEAASEKLDCEPSSVSRAVRAIESELGVSLFSRAVKPHRLTEHGREAYKEASELLRRHANMLETLRGAKDRLAGTIRLASHAGIGPSEITPGLVDFMRIYEDIQLELYELKNRPPEAFYPENGPVLDVVVGYGPAKPIPGLVCRYVGDMPFVPCASPLYLQRHGPLETPEDSASHIGILIETPTRTATDTLERAGRQMDLQWRSTIKFNNLMAVRAAAMLGAGVVPDMPLFHCAAALRSKQLVRVMPGWAKRPSACWVYATEAAWENRRVRVFVDWLVERERSSLEKLRAEFPDFYPLRRAEPDSAH